MKLLLFGFLVRSASSYDQIYIGVNGSSIINTGTSAVPAVDCQRITDHIIQQRGGSSVDGAIAAALCTGLINSYASGLGGGSFMLIKPATLTKTNVFDEFGVAFGPYDPIMIDCRETAPATSFPEMTSEMFGGLAIAVPGELHCFETAHRLFGRLPWSELFEGVIRLARFGFRVPLNLARRIETWKQLILNHPILAPIYAPNGSLLKEGEISGIAAFYSGRFAQSIVSTIQDAGGSVTLEDLRSYRPLIRRPLQQEYKGFLITTTQVPSSGPLILSMLNFLEQFDISSPTPQTYHLMIEAVKFAKAQQTILGDPLDDPSIMHDVDHIIDKCTGLKNSMKTSMNRTYPASHYGPLYSQNEEKGTCHISVAAVHEGRGESVSFTTTINYPFGSQVVDPLTSIIMNNEMFDFSGPGTTDERGLPSNPRNWPRPGKRPMSSMSPTMITDQNGDISVLGGSGGRRIYSSVLQSMVALLEWNMNCTDAVGIPRFYPTLVPDVLEMEREFGKDYEAFMKERGHTVKMLDGVMQSIIACVRGAGDGPVWDSAVDWRLNQTGTGQ